MENQNNIREAFVVLIDFAIQKRGGPKKSYVFPGRRKANVGDKVVWTLRNTGATFYFPDKRLFGEKEYRVEKGDVLSLVVQKVDDGEYPYAILTDNNDFAEGGSFPRMIIRR